MSKKWEVIKPLGLSVRKKFPEIHPIILQLLFNRGLKTQQEIEEFLNPVYGSSTADPFLFKDMERAVERIFKAIAEGEKICVYGDYDADGVTASSVMATVLTDLQANFFVYLPHRELEGYGLNEKALDYIFEQKTNLIVTVDCGISNVKEIEHCNKKGIDVIITDHHCEPPELPKAYALINPQLEQEKYPTKNLAGVGVAFKLACALYQKSETKKFQPGYEKWLLDLVAIGTVCDSMVLLRENRSLVKYGLVVLNKTRRAGVKILVEKTGVKKTLTASILDTHDIGFVLGPRINAAGRIDHANLAYELIMSQDPAEVKTLAEKLEKNNSDRQALTDKIITEIKTNEKDFKDKTIIIAVGQDWPVGVIGLVAGRLSEEYSKPVILITENKDRISGSGRSIQPFDMTAALNQMENLFIKYGGHAMACGFTLKNKTGIEKFRKEMTKLAIIALRGEELAATTLIDCETNLMDLNWELYDQLEKFEPFGEGNERPLFLVKGVTVTDVKTVGSDNRHLKLKLKQGDYLKTFDAIGFGFGNLIDKIKYGDKIDLVCTLDANTWNGNRELQLKIVDLK